MLREKESGNLVRAAAVGIGQASSAFEAAKPDAPGQSGGRKLEVFLHRGLSFGFAAVALNLINFGWSKYLMSGIRRLGAVSEPLVPLSFYFLALAPCVLAVISLFCGIGLLRRRDRSGAWLVLLGLFAFLTAMISGVPISKLGLATSQFLLEERSHSRTP